MKSLRRVSEGLPLGCSTELVEPGTLSSAVCEYAPVRPKSKYRVTVIIPVYDEESTIGRIIDEVNSVDLNAEIEIVVVDDGSNDKSLTIIREKAHLLKAIDGNAVNSGKGAAIRKGLKHATGDVVIIQDADLELAPHEFRKMLEPILAGEARVVYGSRFMGMNPNVPLKTRLANSFLTWLTNRLYRAKLTDMGTAYKVFRTEVLKSLDLRCSRFDFDPEVTAQVLRKGYRVVEVPIAYHPRTRSEGKKIRWVDGVRAVVALLHGRL